MTLQRLEVTPFTEVIREILTERRTGRLTIVSTGTRRTIFWSQGEIVLASSSDPDDSLGRFLLRLDAIREDDVGIIETDDPRELLPKLDGIELRGTATRNSLLRQWTASTILPLFSLESGTAAFADEDPVDPDRRVFVSTPALVVEGTRRITSGLQLRNGLGDLKREIQPNPDAPYGLGVLPLEEPERTVASALKEREVVGAFIKRFPGESVLAARVTIAMVALGVFSIGEARENAGAFDDTAKDLALLASLGGDPKALRVVGLAKRLDRMDYYELLDVPRAATRNQVTLQADSMRALYEPKQYPPAAREYAEKVLAAVERAAHILADTDQRQAYDTALASGTGGGRGTVQQQIARHNLAMQNFRKAEELFVKEDYYGAIVLLRQVTRFSPDFAKGWHLLGVCEEKNPRWKRQAIESFQRALSIDPGQIETMIALGDLYVSQRLYTRGRAFYDDVLKIDPDNHLVAARLKKLGRG